MSEIKKGDLVYVARPICCPVEYIGVPFRVKEIIVGLGTCSRCAHEHHGPAALGINDNTVIPLVMLKKIEPPAQYPTTDTRQIQDEPCLF